MYRSHFSQGERPPSSGHGGEADGTAGGGAVRGQRVVCGRGAAGARGAGAGRDPGRAPRVAGRGARGGRRADDGLEDARAAQADAQRKSLRAAEQSRPDVAEARRQWIARQPELDVRRLIFLDETWAKTNMTRLYGRSLRGTRLVGSAPHGHWKTTTFLAGLRHDGIVAPLMLDGPINGEAFLAWTEQFLAPELRPGDIVIADRLGSHKGVAARQAIEARGATALRDREIALLDRIVPRTRGGEPWGKTLALYVRTLARFGGHLGR